MHAARARVNPGGGLNQQATEALQGRRIGHAHRNIPIELRVYRWQQSLRQREGDQRRLVRHLRGLRIGRGDVIAQAMLVAQRRSIGIRRGTSIIGGRYLMLGSVEYQHPVTPIVAAAVFYDRGGVSDFWRDMRTVAGYGVGARLRTPVGPINLDVAYGQADRHVRLHLSIGYTF